MATSIPGVNEPRDLWKSIFRGWKGIRVESVSTIRHCSGRRMSLCNVRFDPVYKDRTLFCLHGKNVFSRCRGALWSLVEHIPWMERYPRGVSQHCVLLQWAQKGSGGLS